MRQLSTLDKSDIIMIGGDFIIMVSDLPDFIIKKRKQLHYLLTGYEVDTIVSRCCNEDSR